MIPVIDNLSYKVLKLLYKKEKCTFEEVRALTKENEYEKPSKYMKSLIANHFVKKWSSDELFECAGVQDTKLIGYEITLMGEAYIQERRRDIRNFWVPYAITTFIACLNLIALLAGNWDKIRLFLCHTQG